MRNTHVHTLCRSENCWCFTSTSFEGNFLLQRRQASWSQSVWVGLVSAPEGRVCLGRVFLGRGVTEMSLRGMGFSTYREQRKGQGLTNLHDNGKSLYTLYITHITHLWNRVADGNADIGDALASRGFGQGLALLSQYIHLLLLCWLGSIDRLCPSLHVLGNLRKVSVCVCVGGGD